MMKNGFLLLVVLIIQNLPVVGFAQTLKVCLDSPVLEQDLHKAVDTSSVEVFHKKIYESLIKFNKKDNGYYTLLAKKISFPSAKSILIELKKNISFHRNKLFRPKRFLNADDVIFSLERQMKKNIKSQKTQKLFSNYRSRNLDQKFTSVTKVSSHKVLIQTDKKIHNIYELLSEHFLSIYSLEYYNKLKKHKRLELFSKLPIGTGPFTFRKQEKQAVYKFKTFSKYHGKKPSYQGLNFYIITNNEKRTKYAINEKCDITHNASWQYLKEIEKNPRLRVESYKENNILFLSLNTSRGPLKNPLIRKAISLALNYDFYLKKLFFGNAHRANHLLTPNFKEYDKNQFPFEQNLKEAKKIMSKIKKQITIDLWAITVPRPYIPDGILLSELIQKDLNKIGINTRIIKKPFKTSLRETGNGKHDMAVSGYANLTDQQEVLMSLTCNAINAGSNRSIWCNKKFDALINMYFSTKNKNTRLALLKQATLIFNKEKPRIPIAYMTKKKIINKNILNFKASHDSAGDYSEILFMQSVIKKMSSN